ncbi:BRO-N domain-containing protein [Proteus mirabilis]|uniref:BRO-N domain-containing protein n=1 Tax=Proteus mirabilis TaxID=584 RepID=UPI002230E178|nr:BRO family protein [Proteus mirabilis]MDM9027886.1 BRO family protein [Proteus mirabilis]
MSNNKSKAPTTCDSQGFSVVRNFKVTNMNIVAKTDLTFQNITFEPIYQDGQLWFTSTELAKALGYSRTDNVNRVYARNSDEFTDSMTTTVKMTLVRKTGEVDVMVRVFSLRGAHLIAMFASTPVAKEFRKWVLDILDREVTGSNLDEHLLLRNLTTAKKHIERVRDIYREILSPSLIKLNEKLESELYTLIGDANGTVYSSLKHLESRTKKELLH